MFCMVRGRDAKLARDAMVDDLGTSLSYEHKHTSNLTNAGVEYKRPGSHRRSIDDRGSDDCILCLLF